jgi:D-alanyl-lipoteichoic acid acyltransferase DltB (MBOAT superfamily)
MAFFPKLIAGPLVRPQVFLQQLAGPASRPTGARLREAAGLLLLGLFKKIVIADSLAVIGETAFRAAGWPNGGQFAAPLYWQGFYLYAFQIYADFSGYTDLARGSARLLGIELPENFRQPYLSITVTDFWNRWHMSLTQWFREYMYFPLARGLLARLDRRRTTLVQALANLITMGVIGLWHGAAWTFVAWGLWHGLCLTLERWAGYRPAGRWSKLAAGMVTFHSVALGWVLFGARSFGEAQRFIAGLFSLEQLQWVSYFAPPVLVTAALVLGIDLAISRQVGERNLWPAWRPVLVTAAVMLLIGLHLLGWARGAETRPFIYGQF